MTYYFPLGATSAIEKQNIDYAFSAVTASVPSEKTITVITASYATTSGSNPPNGANGADITLFACESAAQNNPKLLKSGSPGDTGDRGQKGTDNLICPEGTVRCAGLETSLSAAYNDGVTRGVNYYVPSGSQYSIVCMEIPVGCTPTEAETGCPDYLIISAPTIL